MFKKVMLLMFTLIAVPAFALAADWQITATSTPAGSAPTTTVGVTNGNVTRVSGTVTAVDFTLADTPAGYSLSSLVIDGKSVNLAGPFTVNKGVGNNLINHYIVARYTEDAANTFTIKSIAAPGGWISKSQTVANNGSATFSIVANPGYTLSNVLVDGVATGDVDGSVTISNLIANHTIQGVFTEQKTLAAVLSIPPAYTVGDVFEVIGSTKPGYTSGVTYDWSGTTCDRAPSGVPVLDVNGNPTGAEKLQVAPRPYAPVYGTCIVSLVVTVDGLSSSAVVSTISRLVDNGVTKCTSCHNGTGGPDKSAYLSSGHYGKGLQRVTCVYCHNPENKLSHAYKPYDQIPSCATCHNSQFWIAINHKPGMNDVTNNTCYKCHGSGHTASQTCVGCHAVGLSAGPDFGVNNLGVRAITSEFSKQSHHVTGVTLNDAHCATCHLEANTTHGLPINPAFHMTDGKVHLRNVDNNADIAWDPANPDQTAMDTFCMACHDAEGATSQYSLTIQQGAFNNGVDARYSTGITASPLNPFADTLFNQNNQQPRSRVPEINKETHHITTADLYNTIPLGTPLKSPTHCADCHTIGQYKAGSAVTANGTATTVVIGAHGSQNKYMLRNSNGSDNTADATTYPVCYLCHSAQ
ncbi:MAG: hypothetical protein PHY09_08175 [Desulfuromonadaceae bacterium]|nr:hypothetical protein [Desulfuromonadaceae bacterium]MDD5106299.1 hypothetical protein [Desulfuromonadaceae bacterium]